MTSLANLPTRKRKIGSGKVGPSARPGCGAVAADRAATRSAVRYSWRTSRFACAISAVDTPAPAAVAAPAPGPRKVASTISLAASLALRVGSVDALIAFERRARLAPLTAVASAGPAAADADGQRTFA